MRKAVLVGWLALVAVMTGCTLNQGDTPVDSDSAPRVVTATLSGEVATLLSALPTPTVTPPDVPTATASVPPSPQPSATITPSDVPTATDAPPPTATIPPTQTLPPTVPPSPVPTRTAPGPAPLAPLDDGSGNVIAGTGSDTAFTPVEGVETLPYTLYYLSDVGDREQVFRLRIGLNRPDQLTFSATGVAAYSVAPDGTLAYISPEGQMVIGGIPFVPAMEGDGPLPLVTALAWSPTGDWLGYTLRTAEGASGADGVWIRNREGNTLQLAANVYAEGDDRRIYSGPLHWRPTGDEFLVRVETASGTPYARASITGGTPSPLWDPVSLTADRYTGARWNVNGNAIIASGVDEVLRIEPDTLGMTVLLPAGGDLAASDADQWADGTSTFVGRSGDSSTRLYVLPPVAATPQAVTDGLVSGGGMHYLWDDVGREVLVVVYDSAQDTLGTAYWRTADGILRDLSPLTGRVGRPQWGPAFQRNDWARVRTTDGDPLNIRGAASVDSAMLFQLVSGSRVAIIGGPRVADGYRWWQVRAPDGAAGWAVESVLDDRRLRLRTLLPVD